MPQVFTCICSTDETTGKIYRRIEKSGAFHDEYTYSYDEAGHLKEVFRNDMLRESYTYNDKGQRTLRLNGWEDGVIRYKYDDNGSLLGMICNNSRLFDYDEDGSLIRSRELVFQQPDKETRYFYQDTLLKGVILPDGTEFVYSYDERGKSPVCPVGKYKNGKPVMHFVWKDIRHLESCVDVERGVRFDFAYKNGKLASVQLSRSGFGSGTDILSRLGGGTLLAFCDQVGTPKLFTNKAGRHIKEMSYDSFGVLDSDSLPELFIPVGFAGGMVDEDTGFVRFGFRDYDPSAGRFTCPDPLGDTGGDHDLYDYCVDDPVSKFDPLGLTEQKTEKKEPNQPENTGKSAVEKDMSLLTNAARDRVVVETAKKASGKISTTVGAFVGKKVGDKASQGVQKEVARNTTSKAGGALAGKALGGLGKVAKIGSGPVGAIIGEMISPTELADGTIEKEYQKKKEQEAKEWRERHHRETQYHEEWKKRDKEGEELILGKRQ